MTENKGDLISRSEAKKLGATCLARRNENGQLEAIISLDNAPTVERPQGEWIIDNWGIYHCNHCMKEKQQLFNNFCSFCGAEMKKEADRL